jgi:ribosomal-protein-alanine N-acetyltransferase
MNRFLPYIIRPMEPGDVSTVVAIERLSFPTPWLASSFLYELHSTRSYYYVLLKPEVGTAVPSRRGWHRLLRDVMGPTEESRVIGYVGFRIQPAEAHISTIAVHPDWRGQGLGELLLLTTMEQAMKQGVRVVTLEVRSSNEVAQSLYRKYGFRFKGVHQDYYRDGEDAWLMEVEVEQDAYRVRLAELRWSLEARLRRQPAGVGQNDGDTL